MLARIFTMQKPYPSTQSATMFTTIATSGAVWLFLEVAQIIISVLNINKLRGGVLELVRVALNGKQECTSQAVAMSLKQLKKDCPLCRLVVSYADIDQSHLGTIYQATNWVFVGNKYENSTDSSWIINGKRYHGRIISDWVKEKGGLHGLSRKEFLQKYYDKNAVEFVTKGKRKYLFPLDKAMKKQIEPLRKPYPKTDENWHKIDRSQFKKEKEEIEVETAK